MAIMTAPMDRRRLAHMRTIAAKPAPGEASAWCLNVHADHVRELLADRDHHAAKLERLRPLADALARNPDLRVGQLLVVAAGNDVKSARLFYMEDGALAEALDGVSPRADIAEMLEIGNASASMRPLVDACSDVADSIAAASRPLTGTAGNSLADIVCPRASEGADALEMARELVDGLARRGASCAELSEGYREGTVEWARCGGKSTAFEQASGMLADIVSLRASEGAATPTQDELDGAAGRQQDDQYAALGKRGER